MHTTSSIQLTAYTGSGNISVFQLVNSEGTALDLSALANAVVSVSIEHPDGVSADIEISSANQDVTFDGYLLSVKFGKLNPPTKAIGVTYYYPKISYTHDGVIDPIILVARQYVTEIMLGMYK